MADKKIAKAEKAVDPKTADIKALFTEHRSKPGIRRKIGKLIKAAIEAQKPKNVKVLNLNWDEFQIVTPEVFKKREERTAKKYKAGKSTGYYFVQ